MDHTTS